MLKRHNPATVVEAFGGGYSQALEIQPGARLMFTAGQVGVAPNGTTADGFAAQADQTWANILALLAEGGMGVDDIVKITGYIVGHENFPAYAAARKKALGGIRPASTAIIVPALALPEWVVEIEAVAAKID
ncbi:MAG: RidA family protein [Rhodospirillales bacterium]|nr:RidA family protein [Rhodospirillales bacterium]MDE0378590.1 RidA family protein [Rhodospirillales bacterium]